MMVLVAAAGWAIFGWTMMAAQSTTTSSGNASRSRQAAVAPSTAAAPQTPRQAILEILRSPDKATLEKHLPDAAKMLVEKSTWGQQIFSGISITSGPAVAGASPEGLEYFENGPVLMRFDDPRTQERMEITVENDDFSGDTDALELSWHMFKNGEEQAHWFMPRILLTMKQEGGIWKFNEVGFSAKVPLGDPEFLKAMSKEIEGQQQQMGKMFAMMAVEAVNEAEQQRLKNTGSYSCNLQDLKPRAQVKPTQDAAAMVEMLPARGYKMTLSGCTGSTYRVVAVPVSGSGMAVCSDESGAIRSSAKGTAADCWQSGRAIK
jgi:hypothetical protein